MSILADLHTDLQYQGSFLPWHQTSSSLVTVLLLTLSDWAGVRWNCRSCLIHISIMTNDVENFFTYLLIFCTSLETSWFNSHVPWLVRFFIILCLILCVLYVIWILLPGQQLAGEHFIHFVVCPFTAVTTISAEKKLINLIQSSCSILVIMFWVTGAGQEVAADTDVRNGCLMFASSRFQVPDLIMSV